MGMVIIIMANPENTTGIDLVLYTTSLMGEGKMEENKTEVVQNELDLMDLLEAFFRSLKKTWFFVLILTVAAGGIYCEMSRRSFVPEYTCTATFSVSAGFNSTTDIVDNTKSYDSRATTQIVNSFNYIIASEAMQERVCQDLNIDSIDGHVYIATIGETNIFNIYVTSSTAQMAYDILSSVIRNYPTVAAFVIGNTRMEMIQQPNLPRHATNVFSRRITFIKGGLIGGLLGVAITLLLALRRKTVRSASDLKGTISLPCMAVLPQVKLKKRRKTKTAGVSLLDERVSDYITGPISSIRVKVIRSQKANRECMVLLVTSTLPSEGKTTISYNLAISLAQSGRRVILVDGDIRNQSMKGRFGVTESTVGLADLVSQQNLNLQNALFQAPEMENLRILAGDTSIDSPMNLINSPQMGQLFEQLRTMADFVIVDAPPTGILADAATLAKYTDQVLYVIRHDIVPCYRVVDNIQSLVRKKIKIIGYVINGKPISSFGRYGYGYGYGFRYNSHYPYGYGKGKGKKYGYGSDQNK